MEYYFLATPIGTLKIKGNQNGVTSVLFCEEQLQIDNKQIPIPLKDVVSQLDAYFQGTLTRFDLQLQPQGTPFQKTVWQQLQEIPFGVTQSYQAIATKLGNPKVIRAAAAANGKNPIAIIIPCHRIIGSDGSLTGYAGGLHKKKWLLEHENPVKQQKLF